MLTFSKETPTPFPSAALKTASATPPYAGVLQERTLPSRISRVTSAKTAFRDSAVGRFSASYSGRIQQSLWPAPFRSLEMIFPIFSVVTAKETKVGGTSSCSNEPLIESLPPIAPMPSPIWALNAPRSAAAGLPHRSGFVPSFSKNSCRERYTSENSAPVATSLETLSTTAR